MTGIFDQICAAVTKAEEKRPGSLPANDTAKAFFAPVTKAVHPAPAPAAETPAGRPVPVPQEETLPGDLTALDAMVERCSRCILAQSRTLPVFGEGNPQAELMFIGEGPGFDEDRQGRPFVGRAGQLLDKMIAAMQFTRQEVYIANIVKCRPPDNRVPTPEEAACCIGYLKKQIEIIRPSVIVLLGATAVKYLLNTTSGISRLRGRWLSYENIPVMPTFHPAFLLRQESAKKEAWQDLQQVMARFGKVYRKPGEK